MVSAGQFGNIVVNGSANKFVGVTKVEGRTLLKDLGDDNFQPFDVKSRDIVSDIVGRYEADGLFMLDDDSDQPSPQRIREQQAKFRDFCVVQARHADAIWDRTHNRELIDERSRRAARYLNRAPAWADEVAEETKECPWCAEKIKAKALFCKECKREINQEPVAAVAAKK
jgi:hypothetical protein